MDEMTEREVTLLLHIDNLTTAIEDVIDMFNEAGDHLRVRDKRVYERLCVSLWEVWYTAGSLAELHAKADPDYDDSDDVSLGGLDDIED